MEVDIAEAKEYCKGISKLAKLKDMRRFFNDAKHAMKHCFCKVCEELQIDLALIPPNARCCNESLELINFDSSMKATQYNFIDLLRAQTIFPGENFEVGEDWFYPCTEDDIKCLVSARIALCLDKDELIVSLHKMYANMVVLAERRTKTLDEAIRIEDKAIFSKLKDDMQAKEFTK